VTYVAYGDVDGDVFLRNKKGTSDLQKSLNDETRLIILLE
jgi:hypothetical protein